MVGPPLLLENPQKHEEKKVLRVLKNEPRFSSSSSPDASPSPLPFQNPVSVPDLVTIKYIASYLPLVVPNCSGHLHYYLNTVRPVYIQGQGY